MPIRRSLLLSAAVLLVAGLTAILALLWLDSGPSETDANFSLIEPGLFMGGFVRQPPRGTTVVLNLCEQPDPYECETHRWVKTHDGEPAPDLAWLRRQVEFIDAERRAGRTVFVHCRNGVSRSGMVVVAYLMFEHGWTHAEALTFARSKRPIVRPNFAFRDRLDEWEIELGIRAGGAKP